MQADAARVSERLTAPVAQAATEAVERRLNRGKETA
jgi:hypothetical protein